MVTSSNQQEDASTQFGSPSLHQDDFISWFRELPPVHLIKKITTLGRCLCSLFVLCDCVLEPWGSILTSHCWPSLFYCILHTALTLVCPLTIVSACCAGTTLPSCCQPGLPNVDFFLPYFHVVCQPSFEASPSSMFGISKLIHRYSCPSVSQLTFFIFQGFWD